MVPYQYTDMPGHRKQAGPATGMDTSKHRHDEKRPRVMPGA